MCLRSERISNFETMALRKAVRAQGMGRIEQIRAEIKAGRCRGLAFRKLVEEVLGMDRGEAGYDELDVLLNRLLNIGKIPSPTIELSAEMVEFYKTPARVVVELADRVRFGPGDVFVDLGAGLGQVVMLVHLLAGVRALGVEIEPAYCAYARRCAEKLGLRGVSFVDSDARVADLSAGTVFYLFTPCKGEVFSQLTERVRTASLGRRVRVIGYGPCSEEIARLEWLRREGEGPCGEYTLQIWEGGVPFGGPLSNCAH
jgi:hypothetical protein